MSAKNERRRMRLEAERREERESATTTPRDPHDRTWGFFGVGSLQAQFLRRPSRQAGVCYEIRGELGGLRLFRSASAPAGADLVVGYDQIAAKPAALGRLLRSLEELRLPVRRELESVGVLDGEVLEATVCGGVQAIARFTWRRGAVPDGWQPLAELVESSIAEFDALDIANDESPHS
ncbi:hypothetical protein [Sorangium sp. So ce385]|uniref:hypothetical protein n=1 Tax=Sorangium sp. So ce385 TaxID=3133308 RepID=UPI003F5B2E39